MPWVLGLALAATLLGRAAAPPETVSDDSTLAELKRMSVAELTEIQVATVYGASKHPQLATRAPSSVSVVTAEEIRKFGHRSLADVLGSVRGVYVTYDRSYTYIGVRGVNRPGDYGGRVLMLLDGHRLTDPIYSEAFSGGEFPLDPDLIDRVEVIRGPGHTLYGDNAFLAVVNVIPKTGAQLQGFEASTSAGSFDSYSGRLSYGTRTSGGMDVLLSGTFAESAGHDALFFPEFSDVHDGLARRLDGQSIKQLYGSAAYHDLTFSGFFGERRKDVPTAQYEAVFDRGPNWVDDLRWGVDAAYVHEFGDDWNVRTRVYFDRYEYAGAGPYPEPDRLPEIVPFTNRDLAEASFWGVEAEVSRTFFDQHRMSLGGEFRDAPEVWQRNWDDYVPAVIQADTRSKIQETGIYLQDEYSIVTNLVVTAAIRYDRFSSFGDTTNPRASVAYEPWAGTGLRLLYGEAYRSPNAYELDYTIPGYRGNPDLEPERNRSYELIWDQALGRNWRSSASLFLHDMRGFITPVAEASGDLTFANLDSVESRGGEVELEGRWAGGVSTRLAYTYADVRETSESRSAHRPANSPEHLVKAAISIPVHADKVFLSLEVRGTSRRLTPAGEEVPESVVANLTLFTRELLPGLEASASLYNLFDRRYSDPVSADFTQRWIEQDGRTFRFKLTYRY